MAGKSSIAHLREENYPKHSFLARTEHDCEAIISSRANVRFTK
ncbi:hypothetical protein HMPREF0373_01916 [Eubacterium ramulus ATCC 29099]|uniref:Uncharacterized protein n=1 Tax=Eubacterium ramulus ATCC 29099 TaxID=1256908 RepID=U2QXI8_EUBRA|nr:hypothetical protein HMPREF0373_01916 [Eubacterium ramulus ATCC 29099]